MFTRRRFIQTSAMVLANASINPSSFAVNMNNDDFLYMPDESHPHLGTWMAFIANEDIWSSRQIAEVKANLALIANTIAGYEPVSVLVRPQDYAEAASLLNTENARFPITLYQCQLDDLWLRDTGPTFVSDLAGGKFAIDFNFNGWGNKQQHGYDKQVAFFIAKQAGVVLENTELVLEGGCFEVDGHGTAIMTKSCIVNDNRNPGWSLAEIDAELKGLLGLRKIIWLEGVKGKDITDGHTDFYARFVRPGEVIVSRESYKPSFDYQVTRQNIETLSNSVDADGRALNLHIIDTPQRINERFGVNDFAAGYVGYYVCNGAVIMQKFGDKTADAKAKRLLQQLYPDRKIEQIAIDGIASGGGSIHCATQQQPLF